MGSPLVQLKFTPNVIKRCREKSLCPPILISCNYWPFFFFFYNTMTETFFLLNDATFEISVDNEVHSSVN